MTETKNINIQVDEDFYWKLREVSTRRQQEFHHTIRELLEEALKGGKTQ